ncbi:unnamed protein product, partial [marine sediment metagenome]
RKTSHPRSLDPRNMAVLQRLMDAGVMYEDVLGDSKHYEVSR